MVTMAKQPYEELIEFLQRELDDRLRVVLRIGPNTTERLFTRSDLAYRSNDELGKPLVRTFLGSDDLKDFVPRGAGGPNCLVGFRDELVTLLLYRHSTEAVAIAFDRTPESALAEFVEQCLATVR